MKLVTPRELLLKPLAAVIGVVERRQTLPVLANVLMQARDGRLTLTATDLEVELVAQVELPVETDGDITLPARKLQTRMVPHVCESTLGVAMGKVKHGLPHFTVHDFRRTARTHLAALGVEPHVA